MVREIRDFLAMRVGDEKAADLCGQVSDDPNRDEIMALIHAAACECADRGIDLGDHTLSSWGGRLATRLGAHSAIWAEHHRIATYILWELIDDINSGTIIRGARRVIPQVVLAWRNSRATT